MIVPGMFVCSSFLISVCMFIVSKALLISSATVIVRAGGAIWLNPFATVLFSVSPSVTSSKKYGISYHTYADNTQLYLSFKNNSAESEAYHIGHIQTCIKEIRLWMSQNFLKLNENKTEFIVFGTTVQLSKLKLLTLAVGDSSVNLSSKVRNLGAIFDNKMKPISHVNTVCQKTHNQLCNIGKIQQYLSQDTKEIIVQAFVTTRLDYLKSLIWNA